MGKILQILELFGDVKVKVSKNGEISTFDHQTIRKNGRVDNRKGRKLLPSINRYGYENVTLSSKGVRKTYLVHRLVAMAFLENVDNKETVNHKNGKKLDNRVENLEWATWKEQKEHAIKTGLCTKNIKALENANKRKSRPVVFRGSYYPSISAASRDTGLHGRVVVKEGVFINDNSNT